MNDFSALSPSVSYDRYLAGLEWIAAIQTIAVPPLTSVVKIVTGFISEYVFLLLLPVLYWLWDEKKAFRLGVLVIGSLWLNEVAKAFFRMPRPFHLEPALGMIYEKGYGFPSGHAQLSLTLFLPLAFYLARQYARPLYKALVWTAAGLMVLAIGFSRLYLGIHFPHDIAGGWILGALLLGAAFFLYPWCAGFLRAKLAFLRGKLPAEYSRGVPLPALAVTALVSLLMNALNPGNVLPGALFLGFCSGYVLMKRYAPFSAAAHRCAKGRRWFFAGFAAAVLVYLSLKLLFPWPEGHPFYKTFRFVRYALLTFWISGGMPLIFRQEKAGT
ncbi:MAG: phosphatase PAP2 family protein [Spirochaetaceae bacterium]|nr:phosphatase PAP2 family protein [Spirochaetaceae bacterium]